MAELSKAFLGWLICFGLVSFGALIAMHLVLRRMRAVAKKSAPKNNADPTSADSTSGGAFGFSFAGRLLLVLVVAGFYLSVLGPLAGKVFSFLNATPLTQSSTSYSDFDGSYDSRLAGTPMELDSLGRPKLLPVPDPISAD